MISELQTLLSNSCNSLSYSISLLSHFSVSVVLIFTQKVSHLFAFLVFQKPDEQFSWNCSSALCVCGGGGDSSLAFELLMSM